MKKSRFTETQIIAILKEADAGYELVEHSPNVPYRLHPKKLPSDPPWIPGDLNRPE